MGVIARSVESGDVAFTRADDGPGRGITTASVTNRRGHMTDPDALLARVEQWKELGLKNTVWGEADALIRDLAAEVTRLQAQLHAAEATIAELEKNLGLCDRMLRDADLLATCIGRSLGECIVAKFNEKSDEIGSLIKLPAPIQEEPSR